MVTPYFFCKTTDDLFSHRPLSGKWWPFRLSSPHHSPRCLSSVLFKFSHKNILFGCHPLDGVTRGGLPSPSDATDKEPWNQSSRLGSLWRERLWNIDTLSVWNRPASESESEWEWVRNAWSESEWEFFLTFTKWEKCILFTGITSTSISDEDTDYINVDCTIHS